MKLKFYNKMDDFHDDNALLWAFIDNTLTKKQVNKVKKRLAEEESFALKLQHIKKIDSQLSTYLFQKDNIDFSKKIMDTIYRKKISSRTKDVWLLVSVLLIIFLGNFYLPKIGEITFYIRDFSLPMLEFKVEKKLDYKDISLETINKGLLYGLLILSIILFDKIILLSLFKNNRMY